MCRKKYLLGIAWLMVGVGILLGCILGGGVAAILVGTGLLVLGLCMTRKP